MVDTGKYWLLGLPAAIITLKKISVHASTNNTYKNKLLLFHFETEMVKTKEPTEYYIYHNMYMYSEYMYMYCDVLMYMYSDVHIISDNSNAKSHLQDIYLIFSTNHSTNSQQ